MFITFIFFAMFPLQIKLFITVSSFILIIHSVPLQEKLGKESPKTNKHLTIFIIFFPETSEEERISSCNQKLDSARAFPDCSSLVATNWNCINNAEPEKPENSDQHKVHSLALSCGSDQEGPLFCCPIWALLRCLLAQIKVHCRKEFPEDFSQRYRKIAFQPQIEQLQKSRCTHFPFSSPQCDTVLTFIRDKFALENEGTFFGFLG